MPHHPQDQLQPHLLLVREDTSLPRRQHQGRDRAPPNRGGRGAFGQKLTAKIAELESESQELPVIAGIAPHLVFRIPLAQKAPIDLITKRLQEAGLTIVSIEPNRTVVAFRNDADLHEFRRAVASYRRGPTGTSQRTKWDVLEFLEPEGMRSWSMVDRIGPRLAERIGADATRTVTDDNYTVEIELWHPGSRHEARQLLAEVRQLIKNAGSEVERELDHFVGESLCLAKVRVSGPTLLQLLNQTNVAEIDLPPMPVFHPVQARQATRRDFPVPPTPHSDGPRLCIIDSGIVSAHPLLAPNVGHERAILTAMDDPADQHGHGTMVAGVAVHGNVRKAYTEGRFASPVTVFSARVLNDRNEFDDERLVIHQLRDAIRLFKQRPYRCRVFNLSLGTGTEALSSSTGRQSRWAEALDVLAREERVLLVLAAGNKTLHTHDTKEAERIFDDYPRDLTSKNAPTLCDPATAAIPLTVGALAEYDVPGVPPGSSSANDIVRPVAKAGHPSPFTRVGPGVNGAIKPELVAGGGNLVFQGILNQRSIGPEDGTSVMSFSRDPTRRLFAFDNGTSYAAPAVARTASILWHSLRAILRQEPHPNLVRALLASSANIAPEVEEALTASDWGKFAPFRVCGYGAVDGDLAMYSGDRRVTLIAQDSIPLDHFHVYPLPIPDEFRTAHGTKEVNVALAFDPPVRRRRQQYLGVQMHWRLFRGKKLDEVIRACKASRGKPGMDYDIAIKGRASVKFLPNPEPTKPVTLRLRESTLQRGRWKFQRENANYGQTYWLVVIAARRWAPQTIEKQDYAVAVTFHANEPNLYARLRERVRARARV